MEFSCEYHVVEEPDNELIAAANIVDVMPIGHTIWDGLAALVKLFGILTLIIDILWE